MNRHKHVHRWTLMLISVLAGAVCLLAVPSLASAGTFTALTCHDSAGKAIGTRGWSVAPASGSYITFAASCANSGGGSFGLTMGPISGNGNYVNGNGDVMTYSVPSGLSILSYSLQLKAFSAPCRIAGNPPQCITGFGQVYVNHTGQSDPNYDYRNLGNGAATPTVAANELGGVSSVNIGVGCDPGQDLSYECPGSENPEAQALVSGGAFALQDATVPSVTNVSGSLLAASVLTGTDTISFTGSDNGGGIYSATLLLDGHLVVQEVPNTNGGLCVNLAPPSSATMAFAASQPCPPTENISIPLDTTQFTTGAHHLQVMVTDAAGDQATAYDGTIWVANPNSPTGSPIGPGSPAALRGPANGTNASDQAKLTARWTSTAKSLRSTRYGVLDRVTGQLVTPSGQAISGATIDVDETPSYHGASAVRITGARTGPTGKWTLALPRGISSSVLRFVYRSHQNDTVAAATATLRLSVHAGLLLHIAPRSASVGRRIYFSGVLHGVPIPAGGKQLVLEARSGREWIQFQTIRTNAHGGYRATYRFKFPGPITYKFRVLSRYEADFPFLDGTSNAVNVHER